MSMKITLNDTVIEIPTFPEFTQQKGSSKKILEAEELDIAYQGLMTGTRRLFINMVKDVIGEEKWTQIEEEMTFLELGSAFSAWIKTTGIEEDPLA